MAYPWSYLNITFSKTKTTGQVQLLATQLWNQYTSPSVMCRTGVGVIKSMMRMQRTAQVGQDTVLVCSGYPSTLKGASVVEMAGINDTAETAETEGTFSNNGFIRDGVRHRITFYYVSC